MNKCRHFAEAITQIGKQDILPEGAIEVSGQEKDRLARLVFYLCPDCRRFCVVQKQQTGDPTPQLVFYCTKDEADSLITFLASIDLFPKEEMGRMLIMIQSSRMYDSIPSMNRISELASEHGLNVKPVFVPRTNPSGPIH